MNLNESSKRRWLKPLVVLLLVPLVLAGAWRGYERWQLNRLVKEARGLREQGEYRTASLALRRALQIKQTSTAATREMAELCARLGLPEEVDWRRAAAELSPNSTADALALAAAALRHRQLIIADQALKKIQGDAGNTAEFHTLAGNVAMTAGRHSPAEEHFSKAHLLEPDNARAEYNLATIRIQSLSTEKREEALKVLNRLAASSQVAGLARRTLITHLQREKKFEEALRWSREQQLAPGVEFRDRITHLDLLRAVNSPDLNAAILTAQNVAAGASENEIAPLINWLRMAGRPDESLRWAETLSLEAGSKPAVAAARAESMVVLKKWADLQRLVESGDWKQLEYARFAYRARAAREHGEARAEASWEFAMSAAETPAQISQLAWIAHRWGWAKELRKTLWEAARKPKPEWALQMLNGLYRQDGDMDGMQRVAEAALKADEKNPNARNNFAMLSLLTKKNVPVALETARELHAASPTNAMFASTYGYALHAVGRTAEGLEVFKGLSPDQLRDPSVAAYYALLLHSSGAAAEAAPYFELAKQASLLPIEKALIGLGASP